MAYASVEYRIMAFSKPKHFVAQVSKMNVEHGQLLWTSPITRADLLDLVTNGDAPVMITLVYGTTREWFDRMTAPATSTLDINLDDYFDTQITNEQAHAMWQEAS